ncbi:MAG: hypothetical protein B6U88_01855 [Candidatus Aenigmarchaeota archaeon ex4484_56]|nr:MAG: hypothetical protein B6U88_01855 [Candidatus Aenigmarchaeota archaeon ex4484_56]
MYSQQIKGRVAKASSHNLRISVKNAKIVCKQIRGLDIYKAKKFLEDILNKRRSINGRYYTKTTKEILRILKSAEKNAEFKNLELENTYIAYIAPSDGVHMYRLRHKRTIGRKLKTAHLGIVLKEREKRRMEEKHNEKEKQSKETEKEMEELPKRQEDKDNTEEVSEKNR